jgi:Protein of unknown function (DUF3192)
MRLFFFLAVLSMFYGCMPNECLSAAAAAETNVYHISLLKTGMNQVEVLKIMRHPYSDQMYYFDEAIFDVWFYVTGNVVLGQSRMMPGNLTPLVFRNGILIGWGNGYYNMVKSRDLEAKRAKLPLPAAPTQESEIENKELEKSLEKTLQQQPQKSQQVPSTSKPPMTLPSPQGNPKPPQKMPSEKSKTPVKGKETSPTTPGNQGQTPPPQQSAPDWSPLEKQKPEQPQPQAPSPQKPSPQVTMSRGGNKGETPDQGTEQKDHLPLDKEDEEMLRNERKYDFDQTKNKLRHGDL